MREQLGKLITLAVTFGMILLIFWGIKRQNSVNIPQMDAAMEPEYRAGWYHVGFAPSSMDDITIGNAYAYYVPGSPEREKRVAWAVAKEGQRIEIKGRAFYVNGQKSAAKVNLSTQTLAPFLVPRGSVFLVSTAPEKDSLTFGPIPLRNIAGPM